MSNFRPRHVSREENFTFLLFDAEPPKRDPLFCLYFSIRISFLSSVSLFLLSFPSVRKTNRGHTGLFLCPTLVSPRRTRDNKLQQTHPIEIIIIMLILSVISPMSLRSTMRSTCASLLSHCTLTFGAKPAET